MSHNKNWINQVKKGNESINGIYYEISGYNQKGPHIRQFTWKEWKRRLDEVLAICENQNASSIQWQQAEEEIRMAIADIACKIYENRTGKIKHASSLNERETRKLLLTSNVDTKLIDRICQTFTTTNDSHHAAESYHAVKERILRYHAWVHELAKELN